VGKAVKVVAGDKCKNRPQLFVDVVINPHHVNVIPTLVCTALSETVFDATVDLNVACSKKLLPDDATNFALESPRFTVVVAQVAVAVPDALLSAPSV
jgi:hypothetical protein